MAKEEPMGPGEISEEDEPTAASEVPAQEQVGDRKRRTNAIATMRAHFAKQPKVMVFIPNEQDEIVRVNGYAYHLKRGTNVEVPKEVAEILYTAWEGRRKANDIRKIEQINL